MTDTTPENVDDVEAPEEQALETEAADEAPETEPAESGIPETAEAEPAEAEPSEDKPAEDEPADAEAPRPRRQVLLLLLVAAFVLAVDVATKVLAVKMLTPFQPVEIIGETVTWNLQRNSGAAFSMFRGSTWVLTLIAAGVVIGIVWMGRRLVSKWWALGLGMILGGALGNLGDRIFRAPAPLHGQVVDFISVGWWPTFNVADSAVVGGAILLVALSLFGVDYDTPARRADG